MLDSLADVNELQLRVGSVLSRSLQCPICSEATMGLSAFHLHLCNHLPTKEQFQHYMIPGQHQAAANMSKNQDNFPTPSESLPKSSETQQYPLQSNFNSPNKFVNYDTANFGSNVNTNDSIPSLEKLEIQDDRLAVELSPPLNIFDENLDSPASVKSSSMQNVSRNSSRCSAVHEEKAYREVSVTPSIENSCDLCGLVFSSEHFLQLHKDIIHKHSNCFQVCCKICSDKFDDMEAYRNHVRECHSEQRYICEECPKTFKLKGSLIVHKRMYHDGSPSVCLACNKKFPSHTRREFHERRYHTTTRSIFKAKSLVHSGLQEQQNLTINQEGVATPGNATSTLNDAKCSLQSLIEETKSDSKLMDISNNESLQVKDVIQNEDCQFPGQNDYGKIPHNFKIDQDSCSTPVNDVLHSQSCNISQAEPMLANTILQSVISSSSSVIPFKNPPTPINCNPICPRQSVTANVLPDTTQHQYMDTNNVELFSKIQAILNYQKPGNPFPVVEMLPMTLSSSSTETNSNKVPYCNTFVESNRPTVSLMNFSDSYSITDTCNNISTAPLNKLFNSSPLQIPKTTSYSQESPRVALSGAPLTASPSLIEIPGRTNLKEKSASLDQNAQNSQEEEKLKLNNKNEVGCLAGGNGKTLSSSLGEGVSMIILFSPYLSLT